jgi:hypothetical protein
MRPRSCRANFAAIGDAGIGEDVSDTKVSLDVPELAPRRGRLGGLLELLRAEGPVMFARHALQRCASRLVTRLYVFELDLARAASFDASTHPFPPGVTYRIFKGENEIAPLVALLAQAQVPPENVKQRIARGDQVFVAAAGDELVCYSWTAFGETWIAEAAVTIVPRDDELIRYDDRVMPRWRGQGIQNAMGVTINPQLAKLGYRRSLAWVDALNIRVLKNQRRMGKRKVAEIISVPALGIVRVRNYSATGGITIEKRPPRPFLPPD